MIRKARAVWRGSGRAGNGDLSTDSGVPALQSAGIEVWFDQSELRGGDVWDRQISNQIRECALFIAVISRRPHSRTHPDLKPTAQGKMPVSGLPKTEVFVSTLSHDWERVAPA